MQGLHAGRTRARTTTCTSARSTNESTHESTRAAACAPTTHLVVPPQRGFGSSNARGATMATAWSREALAAQADRLCGAAALAAEQDDAVGEHGPRAPLSSEEELAALQEALHCRAPENSQEAAAGALRAEWMAAYPLWPVHGLDDRPLSCTSWHVLLLEWAIPLLAATLRTEAGQLKAFQDGYWRPPSGPPAGRFSLWVLQEGIRLMASSSQPWLRADGGALALALLKGLGDSMMKKIDPHDPRRPAQQKCRQATIEQYGRPGEAEGSMDPILLRRAVGPKRQSSEETAATHLLASALSDGAEWSWDAALTAAEGTSKERRSAAASLGRAGFAEAECAIATALFAAGNLARRRTRLRAALRAVRGWGRSVFAATCMAEIAELRAEALALRECPSRQVSRRAREQMHTSERKDWCAYLDETPAPGELAPRVGARMQVRLACKVGRDTEEQLPAELRPFVRRGEEELHLQRDALWTLRNLTYCLRPVERLRLRAVCARSASHRLVVAASSHDPTLPSARDAPSPTDLLPATRAEASATAAKRLATKVAAGVAEKRRLRRLEADAAAECLAAGGPPLRLRSSASQAHNGPRGSRSQHGLGSWLPAQLATCWLDALVLSWNGDIAVLLVLGERLRWRPSVRGAQGLVRECRPEPDIGVSAPVADWGSAEAVPLPQTGAMAEDRVCTRANRILEVCGTVPGDASFCCSRGLPLLSSAAPTWQHETRRLGQGCDCSALQLCTCATTEYREIGQQPAGAAEHTSWRHDPSPPLLSECKLLRPGVRWVPSEMQVQPAAGGVRRALRLGEGSEHIQDFDSPVSMLLHDLPGELLSARWTEEKLLLGLAVPPLKITSREALHAHRALRALEQELYLLTDATTQRLCGFEDGYEEHHHHPALVRYWRAEQSALHRGLGAPPRKRCKIALPLMPPAVEPFLEETPCPRAGCPGTLFKRDDYNRRSVDEAAAEVLRCRLCGWESG